MKNFVIKKGKEISNFYKFYLKAVLFVMRNLTFCFKLFKLPGLSRVFSLFTFFPTKGALRVIKFNDNGEFAFPVFDYYYNMFFLFERDYEKEVIGLCEKIRVDYVFFDGGANLGYISSSFIHLTKFCTSLVAIEPNSTLLETLEMNICKAIKTSNRVKFEYEILDKAISDETRTRQFFKIGRHAGSSLSSDDSLSDEGFYMDTISLNDLVEKYSTNEICFFKLDLEGAEFAALSKFKYFNRSIIIIEILDFQNQYSYVSRLCEEKDLNAFIFIERWINLASIKNIKELGKSKISNTGLNLLLIPQSLKDKVNV